MSHPLADNMYDHDNIQGQSSEQGSLRANEPAPQPANTSEELREQVAFRLYQNSYANLGINSQVIIDTVMQLIADHDAKLYAALEAALPTEWKTPERRTEPTNRQTGYNDAVLEARAALDSVFNMKEEADGDSK